MKRINTKRLSLILILSLFTAIFMMVSCSDETAETSVNENNPVEAPEKPRVEPKDEEPSVASPGEIPEIVTPGEITEPKVPEELPEVVTPNEPTEPEEEPIDPPTETPEEPKVEPIPSLPEEEPEVEEPKAEEPKVEGPKVEEPKVEEPKVEEPKVEEPKAEEPKAEEPKVEEPKSKIISSGKCDDNITWTLDEDGTLIVSGTGAIYVSNRYNYLDDKWFDNADKTKKVIVQEGITSLGMDSFQAFTKMTSITLPSTLIHIGYGAFGTCESLTSITIPDSVTGIGDWSFCGCTSLTSIHLPDKATDIYEATFQGCTNLKSVTLPKGITKIPREFFGGCTSLESITIPDGVTTIDWWAFSGCTSLSEITVPASVTNVGDAAFAYWTNAQSIYIKGTTDGWDKNWNRDCNAKIHYEKSTEVTEEEPEIEGTLIMATNAYFRPFEYYEGEKIVGIDVEIASAIAEYIGVELKISDMAFEYVIDAVTNGNASFAMAGVTVTEERRQKANYSISYITNNMSIIVKEGSDITSVDYLYAETANQKIGVQTGSTSAIYALDDFGPDRVSSYINGNDAISALINDDIHCVIIDNKLAKELVAANKGIKILSTSYAEEDYVVYVAKGNTKLLDKINEAILALKANGKIDEIAAKYIK